MTLFAEVQMAGKPSGGVSKREAVGNGPVTIHAGLPDHALKIVIQPSGNYTVETIRSDGSNGRLSFFARATSGSKRTIRFKRKRLSGTLAE
jgi:hypothetical protein